MDSLLPGSSCHAAAADRLSVDVAVAPRPASEEWHCFDLEWAQKCPALNCLLISEFLDILVRAEDRVSVKRLPTVFLRVDNRSAAEQGLPRNTLDDNHELSAFLEDCLIEHHNYHNRDDHESNGDCYDSYRDYHYEEY